MSDAQQVDLVVIGLGPGGEALATAAAKAGLKVVAVDKHLVGGECPYYGCIPTKMMVRAADLVAEAGRADELSGDVTMASSWTPVAERVAGQATDHWDDRVAVERLEAAGATVRHGVARLDGPGRVVVRAPDGQERRTSPSRGVVLNPGTRPSWPSVPGSRARRSGPTATPCRSPRCRARSWCSAAGRSAASWRRSSPGSACRSPWSSTDRAGAGRRARGLRAAGGGVRPRRHPGAHRRRDHPVAYADGTFTLALADGQELSADKLLVAAGRKPNLQDLGLETVGLDPSVHTLDGRRPDAGRRAWRLWAIGDVTGKGAFTHVSMYQSAIARRDILGEDGPPAAYHAVPHVTFTDPEVGGVGMTEAQAREAGLTVRTGSTKLEESSRGFTHGPGARGLVKVVEDADRGVLVGATVVGPAGGEILGFLAVAVHAAVPVDTLRSMIYAYPTFHRAIESALADLS